LLTNDVYVIR